MTTEFTDRYGLPVSTTAAEAVERYFLRDPSDRRPLDVSVPPAFVLSAGNASWSLYTRC